MPKPYLYVIDIDGTVANNKHREHYLKRVKPDWDGFFSDEEVIKDKPIPEALAHWEDGRFKHGLHCYLTARVESSRGVTAEWLRKTGFSNRDLGDTPLDGFLLMKPNMLRTLRAKFFKPAALRTLQLEYPDYRIVLIEDYIEVLDELETGPFIGLRAPQCWTQTDWANPEESAWWNGRKKREGLAATRARGIRDGISLLMNYKGVAVRAEHDIIHGWCHDAADVDDKDRARLESSGWHFDDSGHWYFNT